MLERLCVVIADDEQPARQRLLDLLGQDSQVGNIVEAANGREAIEVIQKRRPDLLFLDVQMPELDGLGVIDAIGPEQMPATVFVTAFDQHAIKAFEANALDYLLKPYSDERFEATMTRAKIRLNERNTSDFHHRLLRMASISGGSQWDRLVVKSEGVTRFVRVAEIDWIEAAGIYVNLHIGTKELLYRVALNELSDRLDPMRFIRIHRSAIVNLESILQLESISHGEFEVVLKNGARPRVSRTYRAQLEKRLGQSL